jgi:hypothetical protein
VKVGARVVILPASKPGLSGPTRGAAPVGAAPAATNGVAVSRQAIR